MDYQHQLEHLVAEAYPDAQLPGCAVLVIAGDETFTSGRGVADLESAAEITPRTNFRLASVAKQFTAACILKLRDEGKLRLQQRLTDFFPEFPEYGWRITLEQLLRHTSGIRDYEPLVAKATFAEPVMDAQVLQLLAEQDDGDFEPGSRFRYSNSGYALLSQVVEQVTGLDFPDFLKQAFFEQLRMDDTLAYVNRPDSQPVPNRALGYSLDSVGAYVWSDQGSTTAVLGDGGIYTSVLDYEKWIRGTMRGEVLKPETVQEAWMPSTTSGGEVIPYGYGWRLEQRDAGWRPYHPGSTSGFRNGVVVDPVKQLVVLVMSNSANGDSVALAKAIEGIFL